MWEGLRGAMAFALALQSIHDLPEGHGQTIFTATTAIVVLTVRMLAFFHKLEHLIRHLENLRMSNVHLLKFDGIMIFFL